MRQIEKVRPMEEEVDAIGRLRQPDGLGARPASQFVSLGTVLHNLLERLEREMDEKAITKP